LKVDVIGKKQNKLMERTEVTFKISHDGEGTPTRDAIKTSLAGALSVQKERVIVDRMNSAYGKGDSDGYAKVYDSVEAAKKRESNYVLVRNGLAEKVAKAEKKKTAPAKK